MLSLEVGVGTDRRYKFNPKTPCNYEVIFLDVEKPASSLKNYGIWVVADAEHLPFKDKCFALIVASHIIEHLDNPPQFLKEAYRVLKPHGLLKLWAPSPLSKNASADPDHKHIYSFRQLYKLLRETGFKPQLGLTAASKIPKPIRILLHVILNSLSDELQITAVKEVKP